MPVIHTVGALAVAAALAAGPTLPSAPVLVADQTDTTACNVETRSGTTSGDEITTTTSGTNPGTSAQLTPAQAAQLLEQARELVAALSLAGGDARAVALDSGIRSLGITPAVATGWRQRAHDLADATLAAMKTDDGAARLGVALAKVGYSPTPADVRAITNGAARAGTTRDTTGTNSSTGGERRIITPNSGDPVPFLGGGVFAAAILALPTDSVQACGLDSTTSGTGGGAGSDGWSAQADALFTQLSADPDPLARKLADAIARARGSQSGTRTADRGSNGGDSTDSNNVNDQVQESGNNDAGAGGTTTSGGSGSAVDNGTDRQSGTGAGTSGGTGSGATDDSTTSGTAGSGTSGAGGGTGTSGQAWESKAQSLADQLISAGDDPVARKLSEQLAAQGISGKAQTDQVDTGTNTDSGGSGSAGSSTSGTSDVDDQDDSTDQRRDDTDQQRDDEQSSDDAQDQRDADAQDSRDEESSDRSEPVDDSSSETSDEQAGAVEQSGSDPGETTNTDWDRLAQCESSGKWSTDTGNGYSGGLQFDDATWQAYGGDQYAASADKATREQQIAVAEKLKADRGGYSAWPACSSKLGLST